MLVARPLGSCERAKLALQTNRCDVPIPDSCTAADSPVRRSCADKLTTSRRFRVCPRRPTQARPADTSVARANDGGDRSGTNGRIDLVHLDVPAHNYQSVVEGWETHYWGPWRRYLAGCCRAWPHPCRTPTEPRLPIPRGLPSNLPSTLRRGNAPQIRFFPASHAESGLPKR